MINDFRRKWRACGDPDKPGGIVISHICARNEAAYPGKVIVPERPGIFTKGVVTDE